MKKSLQIVLMGFEWDRLIYGLKEFPPKKAILIASKYPINPVTVKIAKDLAAKISVMIDTEIVYVDYYDFDECFSVLIDIVEKNIDRYDSIDINITGGSRILEIAAVMVSQFYPVDLFGVKAKDYVVPKDKPFWATGAAGIVNMPTFDLKELVIPTKKQKEIFQQIGLETISFSDLVKKYSDAKKIRLSKREMEKMKSLFFYHLKKLKEKRLIEMEVRNRQLFLSLTNTGKLIHKIMEVKGISKK